GVLRSRSDINRIDGNGLKQGPWKEFYPSGKVKWEGNYVDDKLQGITKEYDPNGSLKNMVKYDLGEEQVGAQEAMQINIKNTYHPNGRVATIGSYTKEGQKQGLFREFSEEGTVVSAAIYQNDQLL